MVTCQARGFAISSSAYNRGPAGQDRSGILVTKTLVIAGEDGGLFAAGPHSGGPILRAFDKRTGDILSEFELSAHQTGVPMTYLRCGQQDIVVAVGARDDPAELVALTLP